MDVDVNAGSAGTAQVPATKVSEIAPVGGNARAAPPDDVAIRSLLSSYNVALNRGDTSAVLPLYTEDGCFMPPFSPSATGSIAIRASYDAVFAELKFAVHFDVAELVVMSPGWAFARTNSAGTTVHAATGNTTSEANQELFIFQKGSGGAWRIARYAFSPTNPQAK